VSQKRLQRDSSRWEGRDRAVTILSGPRKVCLFGMFGRAVQWETVTVSKSEALFVKIPPSV
jgi:hypothetical protein